MVEQAASSAVKFDEAVDAGQSWWPHTARSDFIRESFNAETSELFAGFRMLALIRFPTIWLIWNMAKKVPKKRLTTASVVSPLAVA